MLRVVAVRERVAARSRDEDGRPEPRELAAARHEVGVEVGFEAVHEAQALRLSRTHVFRDIAGRVDDETAAVAEVDEVGRIAEPLVDEGCDRDQWTLRMCRSAVPGRRRGYHLIPNIVGMSE